jgi:hypothetical protein
MTRSRWILVFVALALATASACHGPIPERLELTVDDSLRTELSKHPFHARFVNSFGEDCGMQTEFRWETLPSGGLRLVLTGSNGFSWETVRIDLDHDLGHSPAASVEVTGFFDGGAEHYAWKRPLGKVVASSSDWSSVSAEHPLYLEFDLVDGNDPASCQANGRVRVPE